MWREEMSVDGGVIDDDHKCLIGLVNDVDLVQEGPGMRSQLQVILARLSAYAEVHFDREQRLQVASAFIYAQAHRANHRSLMRELDAMLDECRKTASWQMIPFHARLTDFLYHWLRDHIVKVDLLMKPFVAEMLRHSRAAVPLAEAVRLSEADRARELAKLRRQLVLPAGRPGDRRER